MREQAVAQITNFDVKEDVLHYIAMRKLLKALFLHLIKLEAALLHQLHQKKSH